MRIAVYQCNLTSEPVAKRLLSLRNAVRTADSDFFLCPELFTSGYNIGKDFNTLAETVDGNFAQEVGAIAKETSTAIAYGYPESFEGKIYNSAQCIGSDGNMLANHRKRVLPPGFENEYFATGFGCSLFEVCGVRIGMLICYEAEFPEYVRELSSAGAQLILVPTASVKEWSFVPQKLIPTRAFENGVFVAYANHAGKELSSDYVGCSCIVDPFGNDLARSGLLAETLVANLEMDLVVKAQRRLPYLKDFPRS